MTTNSEDLKACETCNGKKWFNYYGSIALCAECADHISPARLLESVEKERDELAKALLSFHNESNCFTPWICNKYLDRDCWVCIENSDNDKAIETAKRIVSTNEDKQRISIDGDKLDNEQK